MQKRKHYTRLPSSVSHLTQQNAAVCYRSCMYTKTKQKNPPKKPNPLAFSAIIRSNCLKFEGLLSSSAVGNCKNIIFMEHIYILTSIMPSVIKI